MPCSRRPDGLVGVVRRLEYDPNRNSRLALVDYKDAPITQRMLECKEEAYRKGVGKPRFVLEVRGGRKRKQDMSVDWASE